jgi:hypothetical protein
MSGWALRRSRRALLPIVALVLGTGTSCEGDVVGPDVAVAIALDFLPFPAVVAGDSLRDTTGTAVPLRARAFNYLGEELSDLAFSYLILDRGAVVDFTTGIVQGDSVRDTPVRVVAQLNGLQTQTQPLFVVPVPAVLDTVRGTDTLHYSLTDTTQNVSAAMSVRLSSAEPTPRPIRAWIVSFAVVYEPDSGVVDIVEGTRATSIDTTGADGSASRQVRLHVAQLSSPADSVVLEATAKYRGGHVSGSPARLVVHFRPRTQ